MNKRLKEKLENRASKLNLVITDIKGTPREISRYLNKMTGLAKLKASSTRIIKTYGGSLKRTFTKPKSDGGELVNEDLYRLIVHVCPVHDFNEPDPTAYFEHVMNFSEKEAKRIFNDGYTRVAQGTLDEMNEIKRDLEAFDIECAVKPIPKRS